MMSSSNKAVIFKGIAMEDARIHKMYRKSTRAAVACVGGNVNTGGWKVSG
jgi:hypothetical protein